MKTGSSKFNVGSEDCWHHCKTGGGICEEFCGPNGYCCSSNADNFNGDCTSDMINYIHDYSGTVSHHICINSNTQ